MAKAKKLADRPGAAGLPSMTALLDAAAGDARFAGRARPHIKSGIEAAMSIAREAALSGAIERATVESILSEAVRQLARRDQSLLGRVVNATGVVLHTGLGRAPLAASAIEAVRTATGYCNLEFDLDSGQRGQRASQCEAMLRQLTGAEAALVVNNNAAATLLVLAGLACGREVVVSRGQLIEIGGSFRMPDVMAASGCLMREVGTTNKTHLADYERAMHEGTALLLHVHTSNYRVEGFAESPGTAELVALARRYSTVAESENVKHEKPESEIESPASTEEGFQLALRAGVGRPRRSPILVYDDLGSGAMLAVNPWDASGEPTVPASLAAGADVISFSGDKLLGGPQCGLILGRREVIERLRRHPIARAVRVDKLTIAALQATLALYAEPERARREIPTLAMLGAAMDTLRKRAESLCSSLRAALPNELWTVCEAETFAGGGSLPAWPMPTCVVTWTMRPDQSATRIAHALRQARPPVVARIENNAIVFDARTIGDEEIPLVVAAVRAIG